MLGSSEKSINRTWSPQVAEDQHVVGGFGEVGGFPAAGWTEPGCLGLPSSVNISCIINWLNLLRATHLLSDEFVFLLHTHSVKRASLVAQAGKESACNVGDLGLIPGLGRFPGKGKGYPLQYSGLENSMDFIIHMVTKSQTWLSNFHNSVSPWVEKSPVWDFLILCGNFECMMHKHLKRAL